MAKQELPKEDMIRDATGLVERVEAKFESFDEPVVIGFRDNGASSFYFGEEPVFQFNTADQLRRVHDGYLFKAEGGRLVRLERNRLERDRLERDRLEGDRQDGTSVLLRHELTPTEQAELLEKARQMLTQLAHDLAGDRYGSVRQVPQDAAILQRALRWLIQVNWPLVVADVPNAV